MSLWTDKELEAYQEGKWDERERVISLLKTIRDQAQQQKLNQSPNINALITLLKEDNIQTLVEQIRRKQK
jgi:hypothetical protein